MKFLPFTLLPILPFLVTGCAEHAVPARTDHVAFKAREDYRGTSEIYRDNDLIARARRNPLKRKIRIDLSDQRAQLLVEGKVALDTPVCTGRPGNRTPVGTYPIKEKLPTKHSNIYGAIYQQGGKTFRGDRRQHQGPSGRFVGTSIPYWMRLTNSGIGIHASEDVPRTPQSGGCVRVPLQPVATIFALVKEGTPVVIEP